MDMSVVGDLFANILPWLRLWRRHQQTVGLLASGCLRLCLRLLRIVLQGTATVVAICSHRKPVNNQSDSHKGNKSSLHATAYRFDRACFYVFRNGKDCQG